MSVQTMFRVYGQWTIQGQEAAAEAVPDLRSLRKAMPLLDLVPGSHRPVTMAEPANDDAVARGGPTDRRRVDASPARVAKPAASTPPQPAVRLAVVA